MAADHQEELTHARRLLFEDTFAEAYETIDRVLADDVPPRQRVEALILRLIGLINQGRSDEFAAALDAGLEAHKTFPNPGQYGELQALAAIIALRSGSVDRCVRHLVWGARALGRVELTDPTIAWAWHNLAMAYSYTGFHNYANSAIEQARKVGAELGLAAADFAAPAIRLRHAVDLDQRGDSDGCAAILRDLIDDVERKDRDGTIKRVRPISRGVYGYAITRLGALCRRWPVTEVDPVLLLESAGNSTRSRDLRTLATVCTAIAEHRPIEAVARLETGTIDDGTLGPAEPHRLRALAHVVAGDHRSAYRADRNAFRVASAQVQQLRDMFVEGVAASIDHEHLRRTVAHYADKAHTDPLTGLPNRRHLEEYVTAIVASGQPAVLGVCDLDGFKAVNTVHGHLTGDLVLQRIAGVLNRVMRRGDFVARYGGDEFVVVLPTASKAEADEIARRIFNAVASEDWQSLVPGTPVGVTIGWAGIAGTSAFTTVAEAFEAADHAMLRAKARPRAS